MTQVNMGDEVIETDLPAEAVADLQTPKEPEKQPEANPQPEAKAEDKQPEKTEEPAKPEAVADPEPQAPERPKKVGPIADLLEKKHEAEERATQAEAKAAELEAKIAQFSSQPDNAQTDDKIKAFAEANGIDESIVNGLVQLAREGLSPQLPKEVQDLIAERNAEKAQKAEIDAFNKRVDSLAKTLPSEQFSDPKVREKLLKLAYSTDKAPDGEPYYQKELSELYFAYIKPEVEPGKVSAEPTHGAKTGGEILDYEQIHGDEAKLNEFAENATSDQWASYTKWRDSKQGDTPIVRRNN